MPSQFRTGIGAAKWAQVISAERFSGQGSIALYPQLKKSKYGAYKEAWHLLRGRPDDEGVVERIEACAEAVISGF